MWLRCAIIIATMIVPYLASAGMGNWWSGPQNLQMGPGAGQYGWGGLGICAVDINDDGQTDYQFDFNPSTLDDLVVTTLDGNAITTQDRTTGLWQSWPLGADVLVDAALDVATQWGTDNYTLIDWTYNTGENAGVGTWAGAMDGYMGLQFDVADGTHYGWMRLSVYDDFDGAIIHDWAYNMTPGESIFTGVVPEPASGTLLLAGVAVLVVRRLTRRLRFPIGLDCG